MATETVKTFELRGAHPNRPDKVISWCTGSVRTCAEFAVTEMKRLTRHTPIPDETLDSFERTLRKDRKATIAGLTFTVEPITEEYEADEDAN